jgi:hypothetical protein
MIAAAAVDRTTMAHEVGHTLLGSDFLPVHVADSANLMCEAAVCTGKPAYFSVAQLNKLFKSKLVKKLG